MITVYFGGYLSTEANVNAWAASAKKKRPDLDVKAFPYPVGSPASNPLEGWSPSKTQEIAEAILASTDPAIIVGHSSGCAIANQVADVALKMGAKFKLVALDGFTPGPKLMVLPDTVRWSAVGPDGEKSRNFAGSLPPHYRVYRAKVGEPWPLHGSLVNISVSDEHPNIQDIYWNCSANMEVLGLPDATPKNIDALIERKLSEIVNREALMETEMADDHDLAENIRVAAAQLRETVLAARAAGLKVSVPFLLSHWVDSGTAPGEPAAWTITRSSL